MKIFNQLVQVIITEEKIMRFKQTIKKDLNDIRINHDGNC